MDEFSYFCRKTFMALSIGGPTSVVPDKVSDLLGMSPDMSGRDSKSGREKAVWCWTSERKIESFDNRDHLNLLLDVFERKSKEMNILREAHCIIQATCYWESGGMGGGPIFESDHLRRMAPLGWLLSVDFHDVLEG